MESISVEGESSRTNDQKPIQEFTQQELKFIDEQVTKYSEEAKKLKEEAHRRNTSCIFRVLPRLKEINGNSLYEPNMVSIGPYYYNLRNEKLKMAEDCKKKCFGSLLAKNMDKDKQIEIYKRCLQRIGQLEEDIRKCYSEEFEVTGIVFLEMMVVDACFIIEIIEMFGFKKIEVNSSESDLGALAWMVPYFYRDFLLLENQIPFFVLQEIYALTHDISVESSRPKLMYAALRFIMNGMKKSGFAIFSGFLHDRLDQLNRWPVLHLLDLVGSSLMPSNILQGPSFFDAPFIHCISKLRLAGIKVSPGGGPSFLEVRFKRGVIEMPNIAIDDFMRCLLLNCVAFEQCHQRSNKYFSVYATFLDCLVNTKEDVEYLRERNVIDNYLANDSEVAQFINSAGKDLVLDDKGFYLLKLFEDVDKHYRNSWMWKWASFKQEYFDKPWLLLSAAGGLLLVLATSFQAVMAYKFKNN
ncbi:hypothetical protein I3760_16G042000 [Carya illinoinensis]|uniref:Uncharacterized protein n=1 Tax=Carya illinoinensis TaxID=32201 RepID=A0A8T1N5S1_CARIL|nr:UPF0481 protein At3g47200-like [Carya illinoinensis]KAG2663636.1 hypothetical protein I3760_16G042000 [Carya illinoinensis]KAG6624620.1 hypothetical protein CIPAW_16G040800 [Carya illinoinensis]